MTLLELIGRWRHVLEAIREFYLDSRRGEGWARARVAELEAKAAVCDAYIAHDPNNTTGVQEVYDLRETLRGLQEKTK